MTKIKSTIKSTSTPESFQYDEFETEAINRLQKPLGFQPPAGLQIPWQQRLEQLTGADPGACPFCQSKTMLFLGYVPRQPSQGRSPPALLQIIIPPKDDLLPTG